MSKHSKGPWTQEVRHEGSPAELILVRGYDGGERVAILSSSGVANKEIRTANGNIITAAPELYEALSAFMEAVWANYESNNPEAYSAAYNKARPLLDRLNGIETKE